MKPETALELQRRITNEIAGLKKVLTQLDDPDTATTIGGLKSGLAILARAQLRTSQLLHDLIRAAVTPPVGRDSRDALAAFNDIFRK